MISYCMSKFTCCQALLFSDFDDATFTSPENLTNCKCCDLSCSRTCNCSLCVRTKSIVQVSNIILIYFLYGVQ